MDCEALSVEVNRSESKMSCLRVVLSLLSILLTIKSNLLIFVLALIASPCIYLIEFVLGEINGHVGLAEPDLPQPYTSSRQRFPRGGRSSEKGWNVDYYFPVRKS